MASTRPWGHQEIILMVADRFGEPLFPITEWQSIVGGPFRIVDSVSNLVVTAEATNYNNLWSRIDPWRNELQVYADGDLAWAGPVQRNTLTDDDSGQRVTMSAQDLLGWLVVRILEGEIRDEDIATQFADIIVEAMELDDVGLAANPQFVSVGGKRRITNLASALSEVRELGRDGIDFTMLGRKLLLGNEEVPFRTLPPINNSNCVSVSLSKDGSTMATQVIVSGGTDPDTSTHYIGRFPDTPIPDPQYGLVQRRFHETSILDEDSVKAAAFTRWQQLKPVPILTSLTLKPNAPFAIQDLVAGARIRFTGDEEAPGSADINQASGEYRISSVEMSFLREGEEDSSRCALSLQPVGTIDGDLAAIV